MLCKNCQAKLSADEKAIYMKLVSRNAREFLCLDCFSKQLGCERKALEDRIAYYRASGECTLFR